MGPVISTMLKVKVETVQVTSLDHLVKRLASQFWYWCSKSAEHAWVWALGMNLTRPPSLYINICKHMFDA